jgi:hypothetical protein
MVTLRVLLFLIGKWYCLLACSSQGGGFSASLVSILDSLSASLQTLALCGRMRTLDLDARTHAIVAG